MYPRFELEERKEKKLEGVWRNSRRKIKYLKMKTLGILTKREEREGRREQTNGAFGGSRGILRKDCDATNL
jgi:hypothetical protein